MDEKTLAICAATLCLLGISLHVTLDSGGGARSAQPPSVALASALPALTASFYGAHAPPDGAVHNRRVSP